jgi:hypothetical protein
VARGNGGKGKREINHTYFWPSVGKWWTEVACWRGTEPAAGAGDGGGAPVRKRAWGPAVQLRCEAEKVLGGLIWAMWGRNGASRRGWLLAEVGFGR